jgi:hypothetical protein
VTPFPDRFPGSRIDAGTNVLAVLGRLELYGKARAVGWTRLLTTSETGSSIISPLNYTYLDWVPDDELVLASSTHDQFEAEEVVVANMNGDDQTVELVGTLNHKHFGSGNLETFSNGATLDVRSEVAVLTRNIEIVGGSTGVASDGLGCHLLVTNYPSSRFTGSVVLHNVRVNNCGQRNTKRFALDIQATAKEAAEVKGCVISNSQSSGVGIRGVSGAIFSKNIIYRSVGSNLELVSSSDVVIEVSSCLRNSSALSAHYVR